MHISCLVFDGFEPLDLVGPVEVLGDLETCDIRYFSLGNATPSSRQGLRVLAEPADAMTPGGIVLVPGGAGTRRLVRDAAWTAWLDGVVASAEWVLTVCTGSALVGATGRLDGRRATSNKRALDWARTVAPKVEWQASARWVADGNCYSSSGVSAGIDMALGFVADRFGVGKADAIADRMEYARNPEPDSDPFAARPGWNPGPLR